MVKMEICSDSEDQQISKLSESSMIAYRIRKAGCGARLGLGKFKSNKPSSGGGDGTKAFPPTSKEVSSAINGSSYPPAQGSCEAPATPSILLPESLLSKKGKNVRQTSADPATLSESERCQSPSKDVLATTAWSNGELREGRLQRPSSLIRHRDVSTQLAKGAAGAFGSSSQPQVPPKNSLPLPCISELFSVVAGQGPSSKNLGVAAGRLVAREDLPAAREKDPSERTEPRRKSNTFSATPPNLALITHPSSGPGTIAPTGADPQGPSPMDYSLELEAEFPQEMVIEMQNNAAKKAHRTVIGRTLGGRATFKALHECLKLHLPTSYTSTTLLTRGYFLILFENEEGAISTRKLTTVEWSELSLSFSRFSPNFDASAQGAEALLTHTIKVQFSDLHEQFWNAKALTIMASKLGEVLDIEAVDSYIKRPAGPMVTIEV
jgi:hypothetical protein